MAIQHLVKENPHDKLLSKGNIGLIMNPLDTQRVFKRASGTPITYGVDARSRRRGGCRIKLFNDNTQYLW